MSKVCDICAFLESPKHQILGTEFWTVGLGNNQAYLGRAYITLRDHKGSLGELTNKEWGEFTSIIRTLETAYKETFGANPLNIGCYMNNAYRTEPYNPHVHWHIFPRYARAPELDGITFDDPVFGEFYDDNAERMVSDEVVDHIAIQLRKYIATH